MGLALDAWQKYYNRHQKAYIRRRLQAVRMFWEGQPREQIVQALSITYKTLSGYLDLYLQGGLQAVATPIAKPRLRLLTDQQLDQLKDIVLNKSPEEFQKKE